MNETKKKKRHIFAHTLETGHSPVVMDDFKILSKDRTLSNYDIRTTAEAL